MNNLSIVALVMAVSLPIGSAFAEGEGSGDPFPFQAPRISTLFGKMVGHSTLTDPFQYRSPDQAVSSLDMNAMAPQTGNEGSVQTANSVPHGALEGTQAYARTQGMQHYWASRGLTPVKTQLAQPATTPTQAGHNG